MTSDFIQHATPATIEPQYPITQSLIMSPVLTGGLLSKKAGEAFVIDLDSLEIAPCPLPLTYDHDQLIGRVTSCVVDSDSHVVRGGADLVSHVPNDVAGDVIRRLRAREIPLGLSPDLDEQNARNAYLTDGETIEVNGQTVTGPAVVIYNARLVGVAITPYPTDTATDLELLHKAILKLSKGQDKMADEKPVAPSESGEEQKKLAHPDLESYIEQFGLDLGVQYFRDGLTPEEAKDKFIAESSARLQAANDEIKRLSQTGDKKDEEPPQSPEAIAEAAAKEAEAKKDEEIKKLSKECASLRNETRELSRVVSSLRQSVRFGESSAVPENSQATKLFNDPVSRQAERISGQLRK